VLKHHSLNTSGGVEVKRDAFLISALYGGECLASRCGLLAPEERNTGCRAGLDAVAKKFLTLSRI